MGFRFTNDDTRETERNRLLPGLGRKCAFKNFVGIAGFKAFAPLLAGDFCQWQMPELGQDQSLGKFNVRARNPMRLAIGKCRINHLGHRRRLAQIAIGADFNFTTRIVELEAVPFQKSHKVANGIVALFQVMNANRKVMKK